MWAMTAACITKGGDNHATKRLREAAALAASCQRSGVHQGERVHPNAPRDSAQRQGEASRMIEPTYPPEFRPP